MFKHKIHYLSLHIGHIDEISESLEILINKCELANGRLNKLHKIRRVCIKKKNKHTVSIDFQFADYDLPQMAHHHTHEHIEVGLY